MVNCLKSSSFKPCAWSQIWTNMFCGYANLSDLIWFRSWLTKIVGITFFSKGMLIIPLLKKVMPTNVLSDASEADPAFPVTESVRLTE